MTFDELLSLISASQTDYLTPVRKLLLSESWQGKTYISIANNQHYQANYLKKTGYHLWKDLSKLIGKSITKPTFRSTIESYLLTAEQKKIIAEFQANPVPNLETYFNTITSIQNRDRLLEKKTLQVYLSSLPIASTSQLINSPPSPELFRIDAKSKINYDSDLPAILDFVEFPNGPVPLESIFYIERYPIEQLIYQEISKPASSISLSAPKQMGKSSLLIRIIALAKAKGYQTTYIDFQQVETNLFTDLNLFLRWLCTNLTQQLKLEPKLNDYWQENLDSKFSCLLYLKNYLLPHFNNQLLVVFNELHRLFKYQETATEFILLLRSWDEEAKHNHILERIRFVVVYSTEELSFEIYRSLVNFGLQIRLPPFTLQNIQSLESRYQLRWANEEVGLQYLGQIMKITGGHPYLVRLTFDYLYHNKPSLKQFLNEVANQLSIYQEHLWDCWSILQKNPELIEALKQIVIASQSIQLEPLLAYRLNNLGLVKFDNQGVSLRCELYRLYFNFLKAETEEVSRHSSISLNERLSTSELQTNSLCSVDLLEQQKEIIEQRKRIIERNQRIIEQKKRIIEQKKRIIKREQKIQQISQKLIILAP